MQLAMTLSDVETGLADLHRVVGHEATLELTRGSSCSGFLSPLMIQASDVMLLVKRRREGNGSCSCGC